MQWFGMRLLVVLVGCVSGVVVGGVFGGEVTRVELDCGFEVVVFADEALEGQPVQVWTRVERGSMNELDGERGAAMIAARAAMFGVRGVNEVRMLGLFGIDREEAIGGAGVMVMGSHVAWMLEVQTGDEVGIGLELARGLVDGFEPSDEAIEVVRGGMMGEIESLEESRFKEWMYRRWLPELVDGSGYSRAPLPSQEECGGIDGDSVRRYVEREWVVGQAGVLVVGDVDAQQVVDEARRVFAGCRSEGGTELGAGGVPIIKPNLGGRVVSMSDDRMEGSVLGLVWFGEECQREWDDEDLQEVLVLALAGEGMRRRVNRVLRAEFEGVEAGRVDVGELLGRFGFGQIVAELKDGEVDGGEWEAVLEAMELERRRLVRDGLTEGEVDRAREWLIQQWGYEIDQWSGSTSAERARTMNFLLASGRPAVDLVEWVDRAAVLLADVGVDEVNGVVRAVFDGEPGVLVLLDREGEASVEEIRGVLGRAGEALIEPVGDWVEGLDGPILNRAYGGGEVVEISVHQASGVVSAELSNGVVVHHREMNDAGSGGDDGRVVMVVRAGFDSIESAQMHGAGNVITSAIKKGMIRSRTEKEIRGIEIEYEIEIRTHVGSWGLEIEARMPAGSFERGVELMHALLVDVRIEQGLVDEVAEKGASGALMLGVPIGAMEAGIGRAFGEEFVVRDTSVLGVEVDARSVREWIDKRIRGGAIEIGIAGGIDAQRAIGACALQLGGIEEGEGSAVDVAEDDNGVVEEDVVRIRDVSGRQGVMIGFGGGVSYGGVDELAQVRAMTVAGMVLEGR